MEKLKPFLNRLGPQLIWGNSRFQSLTWYFEVFKAFANRFSLKKTYTNSKNHSFRNFFSLTWSFLQTYSAYGITWNFSKLFSSNSMLKNISTVRRPIRGHRNGSKKITKFHSLNMLLKKFIFFPSWFDLWNKLNYFKKLNFFANWFNL